MLFFNDPVTTGRIAFLVLIVSSIIGLNVVSPE
jgi:multidrug transporter EmrE-like cation transporter